MNNFRLGKFWKLTQREVEEKETNANDVNREIIPLPTDPVEST